MKPLRSRIAPTPSGYLHRGNLYSFLLTWLVVRTSPDGGYLHLRIDDLDEKRKRPEYLDDIFFSLDRLGLDWDTGPTGPDDFEAYWSQRHRNPSYNHFFNELFNRDLLYPCCCSRREIRIASADGRYPGTCRDRKNRSPENEVTWRFRQPEQSPLEDFVVRRRDGLASYQLACVADDALDDINLIIRGEDLRESTEFQRILWAVRGEEMPEVRYHKLICDPGGGKISKSTGGDKVGNPLRREPLPDFLSGFCRWSGLEKAAGQSLHPQNSADLLSICREENPLNLACWLD